MGQKPKPEAWTDDSNIGIPCAFISSCHVNGLCWRTPHIKTLGQEARAVVGCIPQKVNVLGQVDDDVGTGGKHSLDTLVFLVLVPSDLKRLQNGQHSTT